MFVALQVMALGPMDCDPSKLGTWVAMHAAHGVLLAVVAAKVLARDPPVTVAVAAVVQLAPMWLAAAHEVVQGAPNAAVSVAGAVFAAVGVLGASLPLMLHLDSAPGGHTVRGTRGR